MLTSPPVSVWLARAREWLRRPRVREWLAVVAFALAAFELVLDFRIVRPTAIDWIFSFAGDTTQYYLAFAYYRNADWHFPLTNMETMLHPVGASFMLADGIPLVAIPLKALRSILPRDFQFYGAWLLGCVVLLAVYAKLVLERLLTSRPLIWAGIVVITLAPPFVARFLHCHLASHWMLLASFLAVMDERGLPKRRIWGLSTASLFIQPYLFVMVSGILAGAFWVHRREGRRLLAPAFVWLVLVGLSAWVLGYFGLGRTVAGNPDALFADAASLFSAMGTSSIVPDLPFRELFGRVAQGRAEGYAYLGLGGVLLFVALVTALVTRLVSAPLAPRLHPAWVVLAPGVLAMAVFAVSPSPIVFGHRYDGIPALTELVAPFTGRLRSTGRFVWPLFYFVLVFGLQAAEQWLARVRVPRAAWAGALLLVGAQAGDIGPWLVRKGKVEALTHPPRLERIPASVRSRFSKKTRYLVFDPPLERRYRGQPDPWHKRDGYYPIAVFGARKRLTTNTDFRASSRLTDETRDAVARYTSRLKKGPLPPDVVVVTPADFYGTDETRLNRRGERARAARPSGP